MTAAKLAAAALALLFTYLFLANAWIGDDAYITFRVVWNFIHGYGPVFNVGERVQAFTHPLWFLVLSAAYAVTRELFFTATVVSWATCLAAGLVVFRWAGDPRRAALIIVWALCSKALVDYTSSGLENPLSYLLLVAFYTRYLASLEEPVPPSTLTTFSLLAALAFTNRPDAALLYALPLADLLWRSVRANGLRAVSPAILGFLPAIAWLVFAIVYYGFPLPNTYYAKVANGIPRALMYGQGVAYLLNSIRHDPLTLATVALAAVYAWRRPGVSRYAAASALLYVAYTVSVGGDFMSGRFFALPFLLSTLVVVPAVFEVGAVWAAPALVVYTLLLPLAPIKTGPNYDGAWPWRTQNGIKDERGHYHQATNIFFFSPFRELPDLTFAREGRSFRESPDRVAVHGSIGMFGLFAGPEKYVVDRNALSDPLLARLPVSPRLYFEFYAGHYFRDIPDGYLESVAHGDNRLADPLLHEYYDHLQNVTRGSLWRGDRLRDIWALNLGRYRDFAAQFEKRRPVALSIRADNERFQTDVGRRDPGAGALRTTDRAGLLEYGPSTPLKAGAYRARWVGAVQAAAGTPLGFVDVKRDDGAPLARVPLVASGAPGSHRIGEIDFTLDTAAAAIEYRFYVNAGVGVTLERVELFSSFAIPADPP